MLTTIIEDIVWQACNAKHARVLAIWNGLNNAADLKLVSSWQWRWRLCLAHHGMTWENAWTLADDADAHMQA